MRLYSKSITQAVIEVTWEELQKKGFDETWDEIRETYNAQDYEVFEFKEMHDGKIILITLRAKKYIFLIDS